MKKLSILLAGAMIVATGCHKKKTTEVVPVPFGTIQVDDPNIGWQVIDSTPYIRPDIVYVTEITQSAPSSPLIDSLVDIIHSRDSALFEARFKLARVWYYDSLCLKNSRLDKYLKGWIRRALEK
jgi:hypothetical protein